MLDDPFYAESFRQSVVPQAEKAIQTRLVLDEIAKVENIEVSEADMEMEYAKYAMACQADVALIKNLLADKAENMKKEIAAQKAIDLIMAEAKEI